MGRAAAIAMFALAATGLILICWPYYPEAKYQVQRAAEQHPVIPALLPEAVAPKVVPAPPATGTWLSIPAIHVEERIFEGDNLSVLEHEKGAWHQTGDLSGNYVIAGHRFQYMPPNTATFYHLGKLTAGDAIVLTVDGNRSEYRVSEVKRVEAYDMSILNVSSTPHLTLYTCGDSELKTRIVVEANLTNS